MEGRAVIIVDDLTETAGTLVNAAKILKERGATDIMAGVSHAVLSDLAIERLQEFRHPRAHHHEQRAGPLGRRLPRITALCIAALLGEGIKRIHDDESVSSLFEINKHQKV